MAYPYVDKKILVIKTYCRTVKLPSISRWVVCFNKHFWKRVLTNWSVFLVAGCNPVGIISRVAPSGSIPSHSTNFRILTANQNISLFGCEKQTVSCLIISRLTSGEVRRLSTYSGGFDPRTRYQHAMVVLGVGQRIVYPYQAGSSPVHGARVCRHSCEESTYH